MEWDLHFSPIGHPFHTSIPKSRIYVDAIGVPWEVPEEFKAENQITAGFESALLWWSTVTKNVN
jgi:hypothetical protein